MLVGVVSDTHGHVQLAQRAVRMLESLDVACVLHCGDIGSPEIISLFAAWPAHYVFGNVDYDLNALREAIEKAGHTCHDRFASLNLKGRQIAMLHGDDSQRFLQTVQDGRWDLVCYGHTHIARQEQCGKTLLLNPGAIYRANPHSIAVVDLAEMKATIVSID